MNLQGVHVHVPLTQKTAQNTSAIMSSSTTIHDILMTIAVTSPDEHSFFACDMGPTRNSVLGEGGGRGEGGEEISDGTGLRVSAHMYIPGNSADGANGE